MDKNKRATLARLGKTTLLASSAFAFGGQASLLLASDQKVTLLYSSKYGSTLETAQWIAEGIRQPSAIINISDTLAVDSALKQESKFILGSAVYKERPMESMLAFTKKHLKALDHHVIASFVVCGTQPNSEKNKQRIDNYLQALNEALHHKPNLSRSLGGRLIVENLTQEDREMLTRFYDKVLKKPLIGWDRTDPALAKQFAQNINL